jgi:hypothetical protein
VTWSAKSPTDVADYWIDWSEFLSSDESITAVTVSTDAGITAVENSFTAKIVRIKLSGGTAGTTYAIGCTISTTNSETFFVKNRIAVAERVGQW